MKNFVIVANPMKEDGRECAERIAEIIESNGCSCTAVIQPAESRDVGYMYTDPTLVPEETEAIISLGGDGTFIHVTKDLLGLNLPVYGINFGTLGYLTESTVDGFGESLKKIVDGEYEIEERMLLKAKVIKDGKVVKTSLALNDIVVNRSLATGVAQLDMEVDGHFMNSYVADGIIISTPTGSTGYNLSAGGPVVLPTAGIIVATPICAHTLNSRSVVLPADVEVRITCRRNQLSFVTIDGEKGIPLGQEAAVVAGRADKTARIIKTNKSSFIENLGKKMR